MNEPGRRHRGGGKRRGHSAREAGPAQRRRITGGRPSGAPPSHRPRPAPLPRGLHGRWRSQRRRALSAAGAAVGLRFQKVRWQLGGARARTARAGAEQASGPRRTPRRLEAESWSVPGVACVRGFGGGGGRESTGRSRAPARRFATGRGRPPDEVTGGGPTGTGTVPTSGAPTPTPGLDLTRAYSARCRECRRPGLSTLYPDGRRRGTPSTPDPCWPQTPSANIDPLISKKTPREPQAQAGCTCCPSCCSFLFCLEIKSKLQATEATKEGKCHPYQLSLQSFCTHT